MAVLFHSTSRDSEDPLVSILDNAQAAIIEREALILGITLGVSIEHSYRELTAVAEPELMVLLLNRLKTFPLPVLSVKVEDEAELERLGKHPGFPIEVVTD